MVRFDPRLRLPSSDELPCSDDTPVDNEDQNFIPNFLLFLLEFIWAARQDWFFGVDMGIYHTTGVSPLVPVVPDGFLSLGVERRKQGKSRRSYVLWEENGVAPSLLCSGVRPLSKRSTANVDFISCQLTLSRSVLYLSSSFNVDWFPCLTWRNIGN